MSPILINALKSSVTIDRSWIESMTRYFEWAITQPKEEQGRLALELCHEIIRALASSSSVTPSSSSHTHDSNRAEVLPPSARED